VLGTRIFQCSSRPLSTSTWSSCSLSCTSWTKSQKHTNSAMCCTVSICHMVHVQLWLSWSSFTFCFFLHANKYKLGATSIGACPFSHDECQKDAMSPRPTVTIVESRKKCFVRQITWGFGTDPLSIWIDPSIYHSHLRCSARLKRSKSIMLTPPSIFGLVAFGQWLDKYPPFVVSAPFQRKDLLILSILFIAYFLSRTLWWSALALTRAQSSVGSDHRRSSPSRRVGRLPQLPPE
jgi:hypothetical protein